VEEKTGGGESERQINALLVLQSIRTRITAVTAAPPSNCEAESLVKSWIFFQLFVVGSFMQILHRSFFSSDAGSCVFQKKEREFFLWLSFKVCDFITSFEEFLKTQNSHLSRFVDCSVKGETCKLKRMDIFLVLFYFI